MLPVVAKDFMFYKVKITNQNQYKNIQIRLIEAFNTILPRLTGAVNILVIHVFSKLIGY